LAIITQNCWRALPKNGISLEGIVIFLKKILAKTSNPDLLQSIPVTKTVRVAKELTCTVNHVLLLGRMHINLFSHLIVLLCMQMHSKFNAA
jgi:hypothetical protein